MTHREFIGWREFHRHFPIDDFHRIHRPAALTAACATESRDINARLKSLTEWLQPNPALAGFSDADQNTLAAFGLVPPIRG